MESKILIVDDQPSNIKVIKQVLIMSGFEVIEACDGLEGIEMTKKERPFLVLMDIRMPVMDGITAMKKIREIDDFKTLPILAFTAQAMKGDREKLILEGFDEYVAKPISIKYFINIVNKHYTAFTNRTSHNNQSTH